MTDQSGGTGPLIQKVQRDLIEAALIAKAQGLHGYSDYLLATSSILGNLDDLATRGAGV